LRYFLTILAVIVILVLSAALAVPYFVNWTAQRDLVSARIAQFLGAHVQINGPIDLKLLPTPYLLLGQVEIADPTGKSTAKIEEVRLEMALAPLLRGDVDFVEARLVRPQFHFEVDDGTLHLPQLTGLKGDLRFERISLQDGAIVVADTATGRSYALERLDLEAEAPSLEGPFKGDGHVGRGAMTSAFRFSTATREDDRLRFKFILDETRAYPRVDLDGSLGFDPRGVTAALPVLDAKLTLSGQAGRATGLALHVSGALHAELRKATFADLDMRLGDEDHSVSALGAAEFDFGTAPHGHIGFKAKQINLDRLLTEKDAPSPPQRLETALRTWIARSGPAAIPLGLDWEIESVLLGNETFTDVSGALALTTGAGTTLKLKGQGPGQSRLDIDGKVETGSAPAFDGQIDAGVGDLARVKDWIAANLPDIDVTGLTLPVRSIDAAGKINVSQVGFFGSDLRLRFDRSKLAGSIAYTRAVGSEAPRLYADLTAQALDLDHLPDMHAASDAMKPMDLSLRLDSHAIKVADIGQGPIDAGRIALKLTKTGARTKLEKLDVSGLGGMNLSAHGSFDGKTGQIETKLDAESLTEAAALVRRLFPGPAADLLIARAAKLSPAHLDLAAEGQATETSAFALSTFSLKGAMGQTNVAAKLAPDPQDRSHVAISARLDAPEASALFRQLGFAALPLKGVGGGQIELSAQGEFAKPLAAKLSATLAGTKIDFVGTFEPDLVEPHAAGTFKLTSRDLTGLMQTTALAFPDLTGRLAADVGADLDWRGKNVSLHKLTGSVAGTPVVDDLTYSAAPDRHLSGSVELATLSLANFIELALGPPQGVKSGQTWSDQAFTVGLIDPPPTSLSITAKSFAVWPGIVGKDAKLNLDVKSDEAGAKLALRLVYVRLGSGGLEADFALRRDGASASIEGHLTLQDYDVGLPSVGGFASADLDFASTGPNAAALIAGLAGSGTLTFTDLTLPHQDPRAIARVFTAVESDQVGIDEGEITRVLTREFEKQPLVLHEAEFDLGLAGGILRITPKAGAALESPAPDQKIASSLLANLDLHNLSIDQRMRLSFGNLPKNWQGPAPQIGVDWKGPLASPSRTFDAATFTNALAARAIARESARIEIQEFDQHERIVSYQRLQSERRRERERLKAIEDARRAAEEAKRVAAEEAKRAAAEEARRAAAEEAKRAEEARRAAELAAGITPQDSDAPRGEDRKTEEPPPPGFELRRAPLPLVRPPSLRVPSQ
jgi:hypothetical protein